ncbi:MAG: hypothetical protein AAGH87_09885 [Pseudomonadota bacterium]
MDPDTKAAIEWNLDFIARSLTALLEALGWIQGPGALVARPVWRRTLREVRIFEALARRLVLVLSAHVEVSAPQPRCTESQPAALPPGPPATPSPPAGKVRLPGFRLHEPIPADPFARRAQNGAHDPNAILAPSVPAARLFRRLEALAKVAENPWGAARRMARRRRFGRPWARYILRLGRLPSNGRGPTEDLTMGALHHAHQLALMELNRGCPWPEVPAFAPS